MLPGVLESKKVIFVIHDGPGLYQGSLSHGFQAIMAPFIIQDGCSRSPVGQMRAVQDGCSYGPV